MFNLDYSKAHKGLHIILQNFYDLPKEITQKHSSFANKVSGIQSMIAGSGIAMFYFSGSLFLFMCIAGPITFLGQFNPQEFSKHFWLNLTGLVVSTLANYKSVQAAKNQYETIISEMTMISKESTALLLQKPSDQKSKKKSQ